MRQQKRKPIPAAKHPELSARVCDKSMMVSGLPYGLSKQIATLLAKAIPEEAFLPCGWNLDSLILLYKRATREVNEPLTPPLTESSFCAPGFGSNWKVVLERLRETSGRYQRERVGRLTVIPTDGVNPAVLYLTARRFVCARALVEKSLAARTAGDDLSRLTNAACNMNDFEWALQEFSKEYPGIACEAIFDTHIRNYLFRMKETLSALGVGRILAGAFPIGYYLNTRPANVEYRDLRKDGKHAAQ